MNRKGFTLVELLATLVVLAIVASIAGFSIVNIMRSAKEKNYALLVSNVKEAAETYYQECKYMSDKITCRAADDGGYNISLNELITYGFLSGNGTGNNKNTLKNPKDDIDIGGCSINVKVVDNMVVVTAVNPTGSCPTSY